MAAYRSGMPRFFKSLTRSKSDVAPLMSHAAFSAIVLPAFDAVLSPLGFHQRPDRLWVRSNDAPIRQMFHIAHWKGATASPSWGLSLDFVPHRAGDRLVWHRTDKTARVDADLRVHDLSEPYHLSMLATETDLRARLAQVLPLSLMDAQDFWDSGRTVDRLPALFEQVEAEIGTRRKDHPWALAPQCRLAKAFAFRAAGRIKEGDAFLEKWIEAERQPHNQDPLQPKAIADLRQRFDAVS